MHLHLIVEELLQDKSYIHPSNHFYLEELLFDLIHSMVLLFFVNPDWDFWGENYDGNSWRVRSIDLKMKSIIE
jgi:hypothetical protein